MATAYIYRTPSVEGDLKKWTFSFWIKHCDTDLAMAEHQTLFNQATGGANYTQVHFKTGQQIYFIQEDSGDEDKLITNRVFRDPAAWMHVVAVWDTAASETDRMILYINGVRETSFASEVYPSLNKDSFVGITSDPLGIGASEYTGSFMNEWDGLMSHVHYCDGYAYAASDFGETDSTSGIWKIKTSPSVSYGTNGFFLKMEDRTNLDLDSSPSALTMTTAGTLTATYDNPSNNFCTMNSLDNYYWGATLSSGNLAVVSGSNETFMQATLGLSSGKWYWEYTDVTATGQDEFGFSSSISEATNDKTNNTTQGRCGLVWNNYGSGTVNVMLSSGSTPYTGFSDFGSGDILGFYMDLDNNKAYVALNGTIENSGTGLDLTAAADTPHGYYSPVWGEAAAGDMTAQVNFGNGYFGTTVITSPTADAGGIGAFKYDPSNGGATSFDGEAKDFRALCTKNIKLYGGG